MARLATTTSRGSASDMSASRMASGEHVRGDVSTNGVEDYWSYLKRTWIGTNHYWSPEPLGRYVAEHS